VDVHEPQTHYKTKLGVSKGFLLHVIGLDRG